MAEKLGNLGMQTRIARTVFDFEVKTRLLGPRFSMFSFFVAPDFADKFFHVTLDFFLHQILNRSIWDHSNQHIP